jgi:hypothetical protein
LWFSELALKSRQHSGPKVYIPNPSIVRSLNYQNGLSWSYSGAAQRRWELCKWGTYQDWLTFSSLQTAASFQLLTCTGIKYDAFWFQKWLSFTSWSCPDPSISLSLPTAQWFGILELCWNIGQEQLRASEVALVLTLWTKKLKNFWMENHTFSSLSSSSTSIPSSL